MVQLQRIAIAPHQLQGRQVDLSAEQQHYLGRVLRLQRGDRFIVIDGKGGWWLTQWLEGPHATLIEAIAADTELPVSVTLCVALPKGGGFEEIVRGTTELGAARFVPVLSARTLLKPSPQKLTRWRRIAAEAAELSERQIVPEISAPLPWGDALNHLDSQADRYICIARGDSPHLLTCLRASQLDGATHLILAIGPEGGWTPKEIEMAVDAGFQPVSLGLRILRSVTAPVVALSLVAATWETINK